MKEKGKRKCSCKFNRLTKKCSKRHRKIGRPKNS